MLSLRPEQATATGIISKESTLLLADVGAGKTATILKAIMRRRLTHGACRSLVLATKRICNDVWGEEIRKWAPSLTYASVAGAPSCKRLDILEDTSIDVVGVNFDNLIWLVTAYGKDLPKLFPNLVIDESSKIENPASKSFKALDKIRDLFAWVVPATGTPRANHLYDLWGNVYLTDGGKTLGRHRQAFLQKWFIPMPGVKGTNWVPRANAEQEIFERLEASGVVHRMPFKWHDPIEQDIVIPLNPKVKQILDRITECLDSLTDDEKPGYKYSLNGTTFVVDGHRMHGKELQLSSGFLYNDNKQVEHIHSDKLDALQEIVDEAKGEPMMVVYQFDHERDAILQRFPQVKLITDPGALMLWNAGEIEMLLVHPLSCGHGVNAQFSGSDLQVWFTPTTDNELYSQTIGRMNRPGNDNAVRVLRLIMQGTKDRAAYYVVAARQRGEVATLEMFE